MVCKNSEHILLKRIMKWNDVIGVEELIWIKVTPTSNLNSNTDIDISSIK